MPEYAFPGLNAQFTGISSDGEERYETQPSGGMLLRDYFIAHAPAEPQPWFEPAMPLPRTVHPGSIPDATPAEKEELSGLGEFLGAEDCMQPRVREYGVALEAHQAAERMRSQEREKQRYVQWPAAWADEMLRAREKEPSS